MKKRKVDPWFPFWIDKWLFGSTRIELEPDERGVFVDLMAFSKKDDGYIRANEGVPYLESQLCGIFNVTPELLNRTIEKCIKYGKAKKYNNGTIFMTSHDAYSLSARQERRVEGEMATKPAIVAKKPATEREKREEKNRRDEKKEGPPVNINAEQEKQIYNELCTVKGLNVTKRSKLMVYLRELSIEFPDVDYTAEIKKKVAWWRDNPLTKKSNIHLQLRNWFIIAQKGINEAKKQHLVGAPRGKYKPKYPMEFLSKVYSQLRKQGKDGNKYAKLIFALNDEQAKEAVEKYKDKPADFIKFLEAK